MTDHVFFVAYSSAGRPLTQRKCAACGIWETPYSRTTTCPQPELAMPDQPAPDEDEAAS